MEKRKLEVCLILSAMVLFSLTAAQAFTADCGSPLAAVPVEYTLTVDSQDMSLWAYEINGDPYFKLRDLAMALNGTEKQFEVEWDGERDEVNLYSGTFYTPVGGELSVPTGKGPADAAISTSFFWYNSLSSYVISGWHYIKLSDLAASLHFWIFCNVETHTAVINTGNNTINVPRSTGQAEPINNLALMNTGNSWSTSSDGHVALSYSASDGDSMVVTPATVGKTENGEYDYDDTYPGVYVSEQKTAVAYGETDLTPLYVICSDDMGKTWNEPVLIQNSVGVSSLYIGFTTPDDGYLVIGNFHGMGYEDNFVYLTNDGGKTWTQTGNPNELYARILTGAGFANDKIGFLCFRFEDSDFSPAICRTTDGGQTWEKLSLELPQKFDAYYSKTPLSPAFDGAEGILPMKLIDNDGTTKTIYLISDDYGMTWTCEETNPF